MSSCFFSPFWPPSFPFSKNLPLKGGVVLPHRHNHRPVGMLSGPLLPKPHPIGRRSEHAQALEDHRNLLLLEVPSRRSDAHSLSPSCLHKRSIPELP